MTKNLVFRYIIYDRPPEKKKKKKKSKCPSKNGIRLVNYLRVVSSVVASAHCHDFKMF